MKNKVLNIIIVTLVLLCLGIATYLVISNVGSTNNVKPTIRFNRGSVVLRIGDEEVLTPQVTNLDNYELEWESSNSNVVFVNNGTIRGITKGNCTVKAKLKDYDIEASVIVIVKDIEIESIKLNKNVLEFTVDDTDELTYEISPENATDREVIWELTNKELVDFQDGKITALKSGVLAIRARAYNGVNDVCKVIINDKVIPISTIKVEKTSYELNIGDTITINPTIEPDDATDKTLVWESSDEKIVTVKKGTIKAISSGKAKITVSDKEKTVSTTIDIKVNPKANKFHFIKQSIITGDASDAILLESRGKFAMVDTGMQSTKDNEFVYNYLKQAGVKELEFILITHNHDDHVGGAVYLINSDIKVKSFYIKTYIGKDNKSGAGKKLYTNIINALKSKGIPIIYIDQSFRDGMGFQFEDMNITLYNTVQRMNQDSFKWGSENYNSVMELVKVNNLKVFLTGDSYSGGVMEEIINKIGSVDILKVPHHGYGTCSLNTKRALRLNPKYLIVTNGPISACTKYFSTDIPRYYTKAANGNAIIVDVTNGIKITY